MPSTVFGLPTHAILVHATVVLVPLAALAVLLHAFWPAARRRLGFVTPLLALAALVLTPLSTESGEVLERSVGRSPLVARQCWASQSAPNAARMPTASVISIDSRAGARCTLMPGIWSRAAYCPYGA